MITPFGDDMTEFAWDYSEDPDEEIAEFVDLKTEFEAKRHVKFSLNGMTSLISEMLAEESPTNKANPKIAKLWEQSVKQPNLQVYVKKGGSDLNQSQPYIRIEAVFPKAVKFSNLIKTVSKMFK